MKLNLFLNSAFDLKNVNWRYGDLQPYAVAWIDSGGKRSTKIDVTNGVNPVWNEMLSIPLLPTSHVETAILYTDIVHAKSAANTKPLIGSAKLPIRAVLDEARSKGKASFSLILERPSGRPQGSLEIQIEIKDANIIQREPYGQQAQYISAQPQPQPQPQPRPQPWPQSQPHYQYQPRQMNQYPNVPGTVTPGCPVNSPQNLRPTLVQQPGNAMLMPNTRPQYLPVVNQQSSLGSALCTLALGVSPNQIGRMLGSFEKMSVGAFNRAHQPANMGMVNNIGMLGNGTNNATYGNDPAAAQGYVDTTGYDDGSCTMGTSDNAQGYVDTTGYDDGSYTMGTSDNGGYDSGAFDGGQFGTDGGLGNGRLDMGMFGNGGLDLGGFDASGLDLGALGTGDQFDVSM